MGIYLPPLVSLRMLLMPLPVFDVAPCKLLRSEHEKVLGVLLLRCLRKVEAAGNDHGLVDDHNFVVRNRMGRIDIGGDASVCREVSGTIALFPLRPIEDDLNMDPALKAYRRPIGSGLLC